MPSSASSATDISTLSLHDALPIWDFLLTRHFPGRAQRPGEAVCAFQAPPFRRIIRRLPGDSIFITSGRQRKEIRVNQTISSQINARSEEHTSELQSPM